MSRFNFLMIAVAFACFFAVSCEKEDYTPTNTEAMTAPSVESQAYSSVTLGAGAVPAYAADLQAKLRAEPAITAADMQVTVVTEAPINDQITFLDALPEMRQHHTVTPLEVDCPYGDCKTTIPAMAAEYQERADDQCNDQFLCITCCAEGEALYVMIYIESNCLPVYQR